MTAKTVKYPVQLMSRTLGLSHGGFYAPYSRPPGDRQLANDALTDRIAAIHWGINADLVRAANSR